MLYSYLFCLCLILRHDFPWWCFGEELADEKLFCLFILEILYFSRERGEWWRPFQDKLLLDTCVESIRESYSSSDPCCLPFELIYLSPSFEDLLLLPDSQGLSRSEPESNSSDRSLIPWSSKMARTSAVAFSAIFLWRVTVLSCSSNSTTW